MTKKPSPETMHRIRRAFQSHGFRELSMGGIADACGFSRRNLYFYFSSKEEAFRGTIEFKNSESAELAIAAGKTLFDRGEPAVDILAAIVDVRYGISRRELNNSPHSVELNNEAFRLCEDIMVRSATSFAKSVAKIIADLEKAGRIQLRAEFKPSQIAQMLLDGARGTNQSLPPASSATLADRYRLMVRAILHGALAEGKSPTPAPPRGGKARRKAT